MGPGVPWHVATKLHSASVFSVSMSSHLLSLMGHMSLHLGPILTQDDLISRSLTKSHLQRPFFQITFHSQVLGGHTFGGRCSVHWGCPEWQLSCRAGLRRERGRTEFFQSRTVWHAQVFPLQNLYFAKRLVRRREPHSCVVIGEMHSWKHSWAGGRVSLEIKGLTWVGGRLHGPPGSAARDEGAVWAQSSPYCLWRRGALPGRPGRSQTAVPTQTLHMRERPLASHRVYRTRPSGIPDVVGGRLWAARRHQDPRALCSTCWRLNCILPRCHHQLFPLQQHLLFSEFRFYYVSNCTLVTIGSAVRRTLRKLPVPQIWPLQLVVEERLGTAVSSVT